MRRTVKSAPSDAVTAPRGRLFPATKAARYLGLGYFSLLRKADRGEIAAVRTPKGRLLGIYERDCDDWVARHRTPAQAGPDHEPAGLEHHEVDQWAESLVPADERVF